VGVGQAFDEVGGVLPGGSEAVVRLATRQDVGEVYMGVLVVSAGDGVVQVVGEDVDRSGGIGGNRLIGEGLDVPDLVEVPAGDGGVRSRDVLRIGVDQRIAFIRPSG